MVSDVRTLTCSHVLVLHVALCESNRDMILLGLFQVFLEYADAASSTKAKAALNGRKFGGNVVTAVYYPEDKFSSREYE